MKINNINNPGFYPNYKAKGKSQAPGRSSDNSEDQVSFSQEGLSFQRTLAEVREQVSVRSPGENQRIDDIKEQVRQGTYFVESDKIAEKMFLSIFSE